MRLKKASLSDLDELVRMNLQLRADEAMDNVMTEAEVADRMRGFLTGAPYECLLLQEGPEQVGYCLVDVTRRPIYLRQLFIESPSRSRGYGRLALGEILRHFAAEEMDVEVMSWNRRVLAFYERNGFRSRTVGLRLTQGEGKRGPA